MDPTEFRSYVEAGNVTIGEARENPHKGRTMWFNHKNGNRERVRFTAYSRALVTMAPKQPTLPDGSNLPDPAAAHQRIIELEFDPESPVHTACEAVDRLLEIHCKDNLPKQVKGFRYNNELHRKIMFNGRLRAKFSLTGADSVELTRKISDSEITTCYVDDIAEGDFVDAQIMFLGALVTNKSPSVMTRYTSLLVLEKKKEEDAFAKRNLKRVAASPESMDDQLPLPKRPSLEEVS